MYVLDSKGNIIYVVEEWYRRHFYGQGALYFSIKKRRFIRPIEISRIPFVDGPNFKFVLPRGHYLHFKWMYFDPTYHHLKEKREMAYNIRATYVKLGLDTNENGHIFLNDKWLGRACWNVNKSYKFDNPILDDFLNTTIDKYHGDPNVEWIFHKVYSEEDVNQIINFAKSNYRFYQDRQNYQYV